MDITCREIEIGSDEYRAELALRDAVLRRPLGVEIDEEELARDRTGRHFAALLDGAVIACAGLYPDGPGRMRLRHMAVAPAMQGTGVGAKLIGFAEEQARASGVARIETHARCMARRFYEQRGYAAAGEEFDEHTIPHILMEKAL